MGERYLEFGEAEQLLAKRKARWENWYGPEAFVPEVWNPVFVGLAGLDDEMWEELQVMLGLDESLFAGVENAQEQVNVAIQLALLQAAFNDKFGLVQPEFVAAGAGAVKKQLLYEKGAAEAFAVTATEQLDRSLQNVMETIDAQLQVLLEKLEQKRAQRALAAQTQEKMQKIVVFDGQKAESDELDQQVSAQFVSYAAEEETLAEKVLDLREYLGRQQHVDAKAKEVPQLLRAA
jgi:hypothetical protein